MATWYEDRLKIFSWFGFSFSYFFGWVTFAGLELWAFWPSLGGCTEDLCCWDWVFWACVAADCWLGILEAGCGDCWLNWKRFGLWLWVKDW